MCQHHQGHPHCTDQKIIWCQLKAEQATISGTQTGINLWDNYFLSGYSKLQLNINGILPLTDQPIWCKTLKADGSKRSCAEAEFYFLFLIQDPWKWNLFMETFLDMISIKFLTHGDTYPTGEHRHTIQRKSILIRCAKEPEWDGQIINYKLFPGETFSVE